MQHAQWLSVLVSCLPLTTGAECKPDPLPVGTDEVVHVNDPSGLMGALARANRDGHLTIMLEDGTYELAGPLVVKGDGITVRGSSGERDRVVIRGAGMDLGPSHVFAGSGDDFTLADVTIGVANHVVQVRGEADADGALFHNVRFVDAREQLFKVSYDQNKPALTADNGSIEWCQFDFTSGHTFQAYAGGISAIGARDWEVRNSQFLNIRSPERTPTGPAILFWGGSSGTRISSNVITSSDRGIQVGLGDRGHVDALVVNNMVHTVTDVGIGLENARGARVYNNSVFSENYWSSIEYRFEGSRGVGLGGSRPSTSPG